jgi:hypothetical protein
VLFLPQADPATVQGNRHRRYAKCAGKGEHGGIGADNDIQSGHQSRQAFLVIAPVEVRWEDDRRPLSHTRFGKLRSAVIILKSHEKIVLER